MGHTNREGDPNVYSSKAQEIGGTLIGENGLVVMTGAELVEWFPGV